MSKSNDQNPAVRYVPVEGSHISKAIAQRTGEIWARLSQHTDVVSAKTFLAAAKQEPKKSPIHAAFHHWDLKKGAEQWWLDRARKLLRSFEILYVVEGEIIRQRAVYHVIEREGYTPTNDRPGMLSLVDTAAGQAKAYFHRFSSILKLAGVVHPDVVKVQRVLAVIREELGL